MDYHIGDIVGIIGSSGLYTYLWSCGNAYLDGEFGEEQARPEELRPIPINDFLLKKGGWREFHREYDHPYMPGLLLKEDGSLYRIGNKTIRYIHELQRVTRDKGFALATAQMAYNLTK